jgi:hypothetical protein
LRPFSERTRKRRHRAISRRTERTTEPLLT